jgi:hypothetical protein
MWTTGVQGFDTLPHVHPFPLSKWLHMFIRCLHRRSADGTLVLHHGSKAARPSQGIAWEMPTSSHLQPDKVAMKSQWIPWKSHENPSESHENPMNIPSKLPETAESYTCWDEDQDPLPLERRLDKPKLFDSTRLTWIFFRDTLRCHQT